MKGFTLLEVMITMMIMSCAAFAGYQVFRTEIRQFHSMVGRLLPQSELHTAEAIMRKDFRSAYLSAEMEESFFVAPSSTQVAFTKSISKFDSFQLEEVGYELTNESDGMTLWRRSEIPPGGDPLSGGQRQPIAVGLKQVYFSFCDGSVWRSEWGSFQGIRGLPIFVSTVLFKNGESRRVMPVMTALLNWITNE